MSDAITAATGEDSTGPTPQHQLYLWSDGDQRRGSVAGTSTTGGGSMAGCMAYLQLFLGWLLLNMATFCMVMIPHSAQFLDITPQMADTDKFVVFGLWVLVEITLFFILLVTATVIMCTCSKVPPGAGFVHLMVDPGFITLGCIPFLLIRGLPRAAAIHNCIYMPPAPLIIASNGSPPSPTTSPTTSCLAGLFVHPVNYTDYPPPAKLPMPEDQFTLYLNDWVTLLQCAVPLPVLLRLVRFRWKMSWQPFLHSNLYFFLQAIDIVLLIGTATHTSKHAWSFALQVFIYLTTLTLCTGCLTVSTPPIYVGNQITNKYIKVTSYIGILVFDLPFFIIRLVMLKTDSADIHAVIDGVYYLMVLKELVCLMAMGCLLVKKVSHCVGNTYLSLNVHDSECEDYDLNEMEEYV